MGKKKVARQDDRARLELRFDEDVMKGVRSLADGMQVSVNQLMQGLARWAVDNAHLGDPMRGTSANGREYVYAQYGRNVQPGVVWFGKTYEEDPEDRQHPDSDAPPNVIFPGVVHLHLDFTERRVVVED